MRSWLAQSLRTLEDMVDSGELTEEEVLAMAKAGLLPNTLVPPPLADDAPPASVPAPAPAPKKKGKARS